VRDGCRLLDSRIEIRYMTVEQKSSSFRGIHERIT
jgi:hypothetical protein